MTLLPRSIAALDVPVGAGEQELAEQAARRLATGVAADVLIRARDKTNSPSDALAYSLDLFLITHPDAPVSVDADYPGWTPGGTR
ncbi:hypothetical protein ABZ438_07700 [Streptomyces sp. NPDC005786]|uniref:hypothetical protein n=1 Tax=Streptomyces sp. NPDC005786 TaxID=3154891 RepID=UPI0033F3D4C3